MTGAAFRASMRIVNMRFFLLLPLLTVSAIATPALRAADPPDHFHGSGLRVQLVSDVTAIQPGHTFYVGLWIQHEPGFHTYWSNPGLAGVPTVLAPELPPGFTAGAMIYAPPDKVKMAGLRVHGYEHDVLVALPLTAPEDLSGPVTIRTKATWMCCHNTCNPGFTELSLTFPPATSPTPCVEWKPKFDALLAGRPPAADGWVFSARRTGKNIEFTAAPPRGVSLPEKPQFFSADNLICSHPVQHWKPENGQETVSLVLSDFPPKDETRLRGLLHAAGGTLLPGGTASYVMVDVPVVPEKPAEKPAE